MARLLSGNEQTEANLKIQKTILNGFSDEELLDEKKINAEVRKEVAAVTQVNVSEINLMLKQYEFMKDMHAYLRKLKDRNEPLPETEEELTFLFKRDRPMNKIKMKQERRQMGVFSKAKLRKRTKWGPKKKL